MKNYSIVRIGGEYIVQADERSVLKVASKRAALRLVADAAELLDSQTSLKLLTEAHTRAPLESDVQEVP
jgi:hypothetical protein